MNTIKTHLKNFALCLLALVLTSGIAEAQLSEKGNCPPLKVETIDTAKLENSLWFLCNFNFYTENPAEDNNFSSRVFQVAKDSIMLGYHSYRGKDMEKAFQSFIPSGRLMAFPRKDLRWQLYLNNLLDYNADGKIVRLNDSIFTVANSYDIVLCKDGEYAFRYKNLIPEKKRNDFLYVLRNSTVELEQRFICKGMDATNYTIVLMPCFPQDSLCRDTLPLNAPKAEFMFAERPFCIRFNEWCRENIRIPDGYTGNIVKGWFHVEFFINKYGYLNTFNIVRGLDSQLDAYLVEKMKEFPRLLPAKDRDGNDALYKATGGHYSMYIPIE